MTKNQAIKKSIAHGKRMIELVEKRDKNEYASKSLMLLYYLKETWDGHDCSLGKKYMFIHFDFNDLCKECPLAIKYGKCSGYNKNIFIKVHNSTSWAKWLKNAKKFLKQLESLLEVESEILS